MVRNMISSVTDSAELERVRRTVFLALFAALAVALHTLEALLPSPLPWFRLGLANILTLVALFLYGNRAAWTVALARIGIGSLVLGQLFTPGFFLSLSGGIIATALMTATHSLCGRRIGPIGISAMGAAGHALGQLLVAWLILVRHDALWHIFPLFLLFAVGTGVINGVVADLVLQLLGRHPALPSPRGEGEERG
jgi:heptaprenyl diphosphate synthase